MLSTSILIVCFRDSVVQEKGSQLWAGGMVCSLIRWRSYLGEISSPQILHMLLDVDVANPVLCVKWFRFAAVDESSAHRHRSLSLSLYYILHQIFSGFTDAVWRMTVWLNKYSEYSTPVPRNWKSIVNSTHNTVQICIHVKCCWFKMDFYLLGLATS